MARLGSVPARCYSSDSAAINDYNSYKRLQQLQTASKQLQSDTTATHGYKRIQRQQTATTATHAYNSYNKWL